MCAPMCWHMCACICVFSDVLLYMCSPVCALLLFSFLKYCPGQSAEKGSKQQGDEIPGFLLGQSSPRPPPPGFDRQENPQCGQLTSGGDIIRPEESGNDDMETQYKRETSNSYPPIFRATPGEPCRDWRQSNDFWVGREGRQVPQECIGPRMIMIVQLRYKAAQLIQHLKMRTNACRIFSR